MAYRFKRGDSSVEAGVRRIATEQIGGAIDEIDDDGLELHETVHQVRKRCKKLRGLIRVVRPAFDDYQDENAAFREAARALSYVRDTEALIETYDDLVETYRDQIERRSFASVRRRLTLRKKAIEREHDLDGELASFREEMVEARARARGWRVREDGFGAVVGGLAKTFKRARRAMAQARAEKTDEAFHEWRKRVKYHWYHTRLLERIWRGPMSAHEDAADDLGDLLGDHHDLVVFRATVAADPDAFGGATDVEVLLGLIEQRQTALEPEAFALGARLLAEPAPALTRRWSVCWEVWREAASAREAAVTK